MRTETQRVYINWFEDDLTGDCGCYMDEFTVEFAFTKTFTICKAYMTGEIHSATVCWKGCDTLPKDQDIMAQEALAKLLGYSEQTYMQLDWGDAA